MGKSLRVLSLVLVVLSVLSAVPPIHGTTSTELSYPPSYSRRTAIWRDGEDIWILEAVVYSEMPWYIGRVVEAEISVMLNTYTASKDFEIILVARLTVEQKELTSRFLGTLTASDRRIIDKVSFILPPLAFPESYINPVTKELVVVLEGYIRGKQYTYSFSIPIVVLSQSPDLSVRILINGVEDYYNSAEVLTRMNFTVVVTNIGKDVVLGGTLRLYLNLTLIGEKPIIYMSPGETSSYNISVFRVFNAGICLVRAVVTYVLPSGTRKEIVSTGILEITKSHEIILNVDRSIVVEGTNITITGRIEPPLDGIAFLELLGGAAWISVGVTRISSGSFRIQLKAEEVPIGSDYASRVYRVRVPLSLVGGKAEIVSRQVAITVFSSDRVLDMVTDLSIDLKSRYSFTESNLIVTVQVRPPLPVCLPVKIVYMSTHVPSWVELGETEVCWGHGIANLTLSLTPGRYLLKSIVTSKYRTLESLPKELAVLSMPQVVIEHPGKAIYGEPLDVVIKVTEVTFDIQGFLEVSSKGNILSNKSLIYTGGRAEVRFYVAEEVIDLRACALAINRLFCSRSSIEVIKPAISVSPKSITVEIGQQFSLAISASPGQTYSLKVSVLKNGIEQYSENVTTDSAGRAVIALRSPDTVGRYTVRIFILGTNIYSDAQLSVIEIMKTLNIELLTKNVRPLDSVTVKVSMAPQPQTSKQLIISVLSERGWLPVAYELVQGKNEIKIAFKAPESEGVYQVRAEIPDLALVSNIEYLTVSRGLLLPNEFMYILISVVGVIGAITAIIAGRRRR